MVIDRANALCGAIFVAFGIYFASVSLTMDLGTPFRMGPGFFPLFLAVALMLLGLVIVAQATRVAGEPIGSFALRGMAFILPAPVLFAVTLKDLGFVPSIFLSTLLASFASAKMRLPVALVLAVLMTAFTTLVFVGGLGLPFRLFGPWLGGR
ncbi:tripartite tricarboxylate transporter TctB family protein [Mesorhizobium sp. ZMM04-5]|uniref:Tripartite tricarboxylate transporter TctB family protein n=1 Tax=Mesorhizobium marinum TaxID=3228790 RepID=A0ABV3R5X3_9HYPH